MSRQFSIPTVLRMVPNHLLGEVFERLGHGDLGVEWHALKRSEVMTVCKAIGSLERTAQDRIEATLRNIFELSCTSGVGAIFESAFKSGEWDLQEQIPQDATPYEKSAWVWLNRPAVFEGALRIHQVQTLSWWRKRNDLPSIEPDRSEDAKERLSQRIADVIWEAQGRGRVCTVEFFERDGTVYVFAHPDDFIQNVEAHDEENNLVAQTHRQTFLIVFAYTPEDGSLELHSKLVKKLKCRLEEIFALELLGFQLGPWNPDAAYELNHLKNPEFLLDIDPEDRISVCIRKMRLQPMGSKRRQLLEVDDDDPDDNIHKMIRESVNLDHTPLSEMWVNQVSFCFEFLAAGDRKPGQQSFDITFPRSCSLRDARPERVPIIQKYLKKWGIDRVRSAAIDTAAAGS